MGLPTTVAKFNHCYVIQPKEGKTPMYKRQNSMHKLSLSIHTRKHTSLKFLGLYFERSNCYCTPTSHFPISRTLISTTIPATIPKNYLYLVHTQARSYTDSYSTSLLTSYSMRTCQQTPRTKFSTAKVHVCSSATKIFLSSDSSIWL